MNDRFPDDKYFASEMVDRNLKGIELEKKGDVDGAIELYMQNVAERTLTPHPYKRLAVIFTKRKQFDKVVEVMTIGINHFKKFLHNSDNVDDFTKRLNKALSKLS